MRLKLRLSHKGILLVALMLAFELFLLSGLWFLLKRTEDAERRAMYTKEVTAEVNGLITLFYRGAAALITSTFSQSQITEYSTLSHEFSAQWLKLRDLVKQDPVGTGYLDKLEPPMRRTMQIMGRAQELVTGPYRFSSFRTIAAPGELMNIVSTTVNGLQDLKAYEENKYKDDPILSYREQLEEAFLIGIIANIFFAFGIAGYVFSDLIRRIERLSQNTIRLASGERLIPQEHGSDEIAQLDSMFHKMAGELDRAVQMERAIIENALDVICTIDESGKFIQMSPASLALWGYAGADLLGMRVSALVASEDVDRTTAILTDTISSGGPASFENKVKRKDGSEADTLWSMRWYAPERRLLCICHDISQRKEIERLRREFVTMVSHDLKTPLSSVSTSVALVHAGVYGKLDPRGQDILQQTEEEIERLIQLIGGLLDVARMEAGKMELDIAEASVSDMLTRSVNAVKGFAEKKNISLVSEPTEFLMQADAARLTQVIVNLLSNSVKFSGENTEVRVGAFDIGEFMEIRVTDQGPGVPPDQRELVFERFERADNKKNSKVEGTGLGLAICKSIVDAHSGMIGIRDNPSGGAVFWFRIPKTPAESAAR